MKYQSRRLKELVRQKNFILSHLQFLIVIGTGYIAEGEKIKRVWFNDGDRDSYNLGMDVLDWTNEQIRMEQEALRLFKERAGLIDE